LQGRSNDPAISASSPRPSSATWPCWGTSKPQLFPQNIGDGLSIHFTLATLVVPLGISFPTIQQIAMLIDLRRGAAKLPPPLNYAMFVPVLSAAILTFRPIATTNM
jgi:D-alanyl-lipoteichoic acid acyltransferase DltB (MBOAT superfamily)